MNVVQKEKKLPYILTLTTTTLRPTSDVAVVPSANCYQAWMEELHKLYGCSVETDKTLEVHPPKPKLHQMNPKTWFSDLVEVKASIQLALALFCFVFYFDCKF